MRFIKTCIISVGMSLLLIGGFAGIVQAYSTEITYDFGGITIDDGAVYYDPGILVVICGRPERLVEMLKPPSEIFPNYNPLENFYFVLDPVVGTTLVFEPDSQAELEDSSYLAGNLSVLENWPLASSDFTRIIFSLVISESDEILVNDQYVIGNIRYEQANLTFSFTVSAAEPSSSAIPEPSTLVLLGLGLFGGICLIKRKNRSRLLLILFAILLLSLMNPVAAHAEWVCFINPSCEEAPVLLNEIVSNAQKVELEIIIPGMEVIEEEGRQLLNIPGGDYLTQVGKPQVPKIRHYLTLPVTPNANDLSIEVFDSTFRRLNGYNLYSAWDYPVENTFYPSLTELITYNGPYGSILILDVFPVHYNSATEELLVYSQIKVRISFEKPPFERCDSVAEVPKAECEALQILYKSTNGDRWEKNENWLKTNTPCSWEGIECSDGHVEKLTLSSNQLKGYIPAELGNFAHLHELKLDHNPLQGSLPANLVNLDELELFWYQETNLCRPQDTEFQDWLLDVDDVQGTDDTCFFFDYFVYDEYGGTWKDVNKTEPDESNLCWAFSASNLLDWTGWSVFDTLFKIFHDYKANWTNNGSLMKYAWRWWLNGTPPPSTFGEEWARLKPEASGGQYWGEYNFSDSYRFHYKTNVMGAIKEFLHNGFGVAIALYESGDSQGVGHALTVWGYRYYADGTVMGLWVTDSDDYGNEKFDEVRNLLSSQGLWVTKPDDPTSDLRYIPVTYQANWIGVGSDRYLYELKWRLADMEEAYPYQGWLIEGVQALRHRDLKVLRVLRAGTGTGHVLSASEGIDCGDDCVQIYSTATTVTLAAAPASGSRFLGWGGECNITDTGACAVTVDERKNVIAVFEALPDPSVETFTIATNADSSVTLYPSDDGQGAPEGSDATLVFTSDDQHQIVDVIVDGRSVGPVTTYTFTDVFTNHEIEIKTFDKEPTFTIARKKCIKLDDAGNIVYDDAGNEIEIECTPGQNATVIIGDQVCDSECTRVIVPFTEGSAMILKVVPDAGSLFLRWETGNGEPVEGFVYTEEDLFLRPVIACSGHN